MQEAVDIDAGDARGHQQQRQREALKRHGAVVLATQQRHHHRHHADDQRGRGKAGVFHPCREQHVVHDVPGQCMPYQRRIVGGDEGAEQGFQARQQQGEGHCAIGEVAADRQLQRREGAQHLRHDEHQAPHRPGQQAAQHSDPHTRPTSKGAILHPGV